MSGRTLHGRLDALARRLGRREPRRRPLFDELLREPTAALVEGLMARRRPSAEGLGLAEERYLPGEDEAVELLLEALAERLPAGGGPPATSTEVHGLVRAELAIENDLPRRYRKGIFAEPRTYPAWACFHGPGPASARDVDAPWLAPDGVSGPRLDVKLMNVPGAKLLDDERHTQDLCSAGAPASPVSSVLERAELERWRRRKQPLLYFLDPRQHHLLELLLHALYAEPTPNPLERRYYGIGPLLLGQGLAMKLSLRPRALPRPVSPGTPDDPRGAMRRTLAGEDVLFDLLIQLQTDPQAMPIEDGAVRWPEQLSPWRAAGTLRIPPQELDSPERHSLAQRLRFTPWHALPEHRPLGSQSRALRVLYQARLAAERRHAPQLGHLEPAPPYPAQTEEQGARSATRQARHGATPVVAAGGRGRS